MSPGPGNLRDKTMMINKITPSIDESHWLKSLKPANQYLTKNQTFLSKVFIKLYSPISPLSLIKSSNIMAATEINIQKNYQ